MCRLEYGVRVRLAELEAVRDAKQKRQSAVLRRQDGLIDLRTVIAATRDQHGHLGEQRLIEAGLQRLDQAVLRQKMLRIRHELQCNLVRAQHFGRLAQVCAARDPMYMHTRNPTCGFRCQAEPADRPSN